MTADNQPEELDPADVDPADVELLAQLRDAVLGSDRPPDRLRDAALRALTWDADMETLLAAFDSAKEPATLRSTTRTRDLTYELEGVVEVAVTVSDQDGPALTGSVEPASHLVTLIQPGQPDQPVEVDEFGRFHIPLDDTTGSLAGLLITTETGRQIRTELFSLDPDASDS